MQNNKKLFRIRLSQLVPSDNEIEAGCYMKGFLNYVLLSHNIDKGTIFKDEQLFTFGVYSRFALWYNSCKVAIVMMPNDSPFDAAGPL
ncbi:hypothetical protein ACS3UN_07840 [Oscillospiraceae bacterium LTW-04]|nr:hypothetical protein RBH76_02505 [Oscillospiraceae bacterium MB24-C1]